MASYPQRSRAEVEVDGLRFELFARRVMLALVVIACLGATAVAIICALYGSPWPGTGLAVVVAVLVKGSGFSSAPSDEPLAKALSLLIDDESDHREDER